MGVVEKFWRELTKPVMSVMDARFLWLFLPATIILVQDWPTYEAFAITFCVVYMLAGVSHFVRKLMMPYIDLSVYAKVATESPIASAIVFASVLTFWLALTLIPLYWLKP